MVRSPHRGGPARRLTAVRADVVAGDGLGHRHRPILGHRALANGFRTHIVPKPAVIPSVFGNVR